MLKIHHKRATLKKLSIDHANKLVSLLRMRLRKPINAPLKAYFINDTLIKEILTATPNRLIELNAIIYKKLLVSHTKKVIDACARRVFDYDLFKDRDHSKYRADDLYHNIGFVTCPYCNIRDIRPTYNATGKVVARGPLDHFFSDGKYPILRLSFYNLIPACTFCNTNFKLGKPMNLYKNVHPYIKGFDNNCVFDLTGFTSIDDIFSKKKGFFELYFKKSTANLRYDGNMKLFSLLSQYGGHKDGARRALRIAKTYTKAQLDSIMLATHLKHHEAYEDIFATKFKLDELHLNPLSKLNRDIVREYGNPDLKTILKIK